MGLRWTWALPTSSSPPAAWSADRAPQQELASSRRRGGWPARAGGLALVGYCLLRVIVSGVLYPWKYYAGDFFASFPPPYVRHTNPTLFANSDPWEKGRRYGYGPGQYLVMHPLTHINHPKTIARVLLPIYWLLIVLTAAAVYQQCWAAGWRLVPIAFFVLLWTHFVPLYDNLMQRNIELFELALLVTAFGLVRSSGSAPSTARAGPRAGQSLPARPSRARWRAGLAGALTGLAALCKFRPLSMASYFLIKRQWVALLGLAVVVGGGLWLTDRLVGLDHFAYFNRRGVGAITAWCDGAYWAGAATTVDVPQAVVRWATGFDVCSATRPRLRAADPRTTGAWVLTIIGLLGGLTLLALLRCGARPDAEALRFCLVLTAATVLLPHAHWYYDVYLLVPCSYLGGRVFRAWSRHRRVDRVVLIGGGLAWLLIGGGPVPLSVYGRLLRGCIGYSMSDAWVLLNLPTIGGLLLLAVLIRQGLTRSADQPAVSPV